MSIALGTDLVHVARIQRIYSRFPERCARKIFTSDELEVSLSRPDPARALAGRFAGKEAVMKALGTGWTQGIRFIDIEITSDSDNRPDVSLTGQAAVCAQSMGINRWLISLSYEGDYALAFVIAEE